MVDTQLSMVNDCIFVVVILSKEIKRKEMEELNAMLAELGIAPDDSVKKDANGESSSAKKRKSRRKNLSLDAGLGDPKPEDFDAASKNEAEELPQAGTQDTEECREQEAVQEPYALKVTYI